MASKARLYALTSLVAAALAGCILQGGSLLAAQTQNASAGPSAKTAEQQFKNIQVLKGVPADQVIPTMQFISGSLGVECEFCHVEAAFDKDDKLIPVSNAYQLEALLKKKSVPYEIKIYPHQGHGFDGDALADANQRAVAFLKAHLP